MKRILAILMTLCMACAAVGAGADTDIPDFDSMPNVVLEDEDTIVEETAFEGEWILSAAFVSTDYIDSATLADEFGINYLFPFTIADGKISQELQNEYGEFVTHEMTYVLEAGQLQAKTEDGRDFVVELLEDGNIVMSVFYPDEDGTVICVSLFMAPIEIAE